MLLINTFSPNMIEGNFTAYFEQIKLQKAYNWLRKDTFISAISSKEVAYLFGSILQIPLGVSNVNIAMSSGSQAVLGLYKGPKIRNKQTRLLPNTSIKWYLLTVD